MKRLIIILLCALMPLTALTGCEGQEAPAQVPTLEENSHSAEEVPFIRTDSFTSPREEAGTTEEVETYSSYEELLESMYVREGGFFFKAGEREEISTWPQDEERDFVFYPKPGEYGDERLERQRQMENLIEDNNRLYMDCLSGNPPEGDYTVKPEEYPEFMSQGSLPTDDLEKLPREWFENQRLIVDYFANEYDAGLRSRIRNEYIMAEAEYFASLGLPVQVYAKDDLSDGQEISTYICVVTLTPRRLLELSGEAEGLYTVEQLFDRVKTSHHRPVWTSEGA